MEKELIEMDVTLSKVRLKEILEAPERFEPTCHLKWKCPLIIENHNPGMITAQPHIYQNSTPILHQLWISTQGKQEWRPIEHESTNI